MILKDMSQPIKQCKGVIVNHLNNEVCDRCGMQDPIPRSYGFGKVGYNLCRFCAKKWEEFIRNEYNPKKWHEKKVKWENYANKILSDFVLRVDEPEKVEFT